MDVFAYGEAAHQLERALVVQDLVDPEDRSKRCDLLLALGRGTVAAGETESVIAQSRRMRSHWPRRWATGAARFAPAVWHWTVSEAEGASSLIRRPEYLRWAELAHGYANSTA